MDNPLPSRRYPWGDKFDVQKCNTPESQKGDTTPVGAYSPAGNNPYGVADMAGNVWEWCLNEHEHPERIQEEGDAKRALRGGSWDNLRGSAVSSYRDFNRPVARSRYYGFRAVAVLSPP